MGLAAHSISGTLVRVALTDRERIELFLALHDEYRALGTAFPVDNYTFQIGGPPRDPADWWARLVRAMTLRKFVLAKTDDVHLTKVLAALARVAPDEEASAGRDIAELQDAVADRSSAVVYRMPDANGDRQPEELVVDVLYGAYMHGDADKWARYTATPSLLVEHALWSWVVDAERLTEAARSVIEERITTAAPPE